MNLEDKVPKIREGDVASVAADTRLGREVRSMGIPPMVSEDNQSKESLALCRSMRDRKRPADLTDFVLS
ncbi:hypothetical protein V6N12_033999 [Hibiscus sabdariffa]|uniref:Uncharacterized protein n=1 Tax=Hibiscus sabdariffa TaxID=183260 RepID=A0ABR2B406_9ROSI